MARPRTVSDADILGETLRCLLEQGPSVSLDVIAGHLGVSSQALLKRFGNRRDLVMAALRPPRRSPWHDLVESGPDDRPFAEQLTEIVSQVAAFFVDMTRRMAVLRWSGIEPQELMKSFSEPPPVRDIRLLAGWFERAEARGLTQGGDHRATAMVLLSSLHTPAMLHEIMGRYPLADGKEAFHAALVELLSTACRAGGDSPNTAPAGDGDDGLPSAPFAVS